jgi:hypothetical protein
VAGTGEHINKSLNSVESKEFSDYRNRKKGCTVVR